MEKVDKDVMDMTKKSFLKSIKLLKEVKHKIKNDNFLFTLLKYHHGTFNVCLLSSNEDCLQSIEQDVDLLNRIQPYCNEDQTKQLEEIKKEIISYLTFIRITCDF